MFKVMVHPERKLILFPVPDVATTPREILLTEEVIKELLSSDKEKVLLCAVPFLESVGVLPTFVPLKLTVRYSDAAYVLKLEIVSVAEETVPFVTAPESYVIFPKVALVPPFKSLLELLVTDAEIVLVPVATFYHLISSLARSSLRQDWLVHRLRNKQWAASENLCNKDSILY